MDKILDIKNGIIKSSSLKQKGEHIILCGGCFDILHIGHIRFLEEAKKLGGKLFILLESDRKVKELKGENRPIFKQADRALALSSLQDADVIIMLPFFSDDSKYRQLVAKLKPDIIAVTQNDPKIEIKQKQAQGVGAELKIIPFVKSLSSSKLAQILSREKNY